MEKYINKLSAKKLMFIGGILLLLGNIIAFITVFTVYDKASEALDGNPNVSLSIEQVTADIARIMSIVGALILVSGIILFLVARSKHK